MKKTTIAKALLISASVAIAAPSMANDQKSAKQNHYGYVKTQPAAQKTPAHNPKAVPELNAASATIVGSMALGLVLLSAERRRRAKHEQD